MEAATVRERGVRPVWFRLVRVREGLGRTDLSRGCEPLGQLADPGGLDRGLDGEPLYGRASLGDRKSTRLNSSHGYISYAVFCLKKKIPQYIQQLLGYTAQLAGMALSSGGAGIKCMIPGVGILVSNGETRGLVPFRYIVSPYVLV